TARLLDDKGVQEYLRCTRPVGAAPRPAVEAVPAAAGVMQHVRETLPLLLRDHGDVAVQLETYVPPRCAFAATADQKQRLPLEPMVKRAMLEGDFRAQGVSSRVLVVEGAAGSGKSLFGWRLCGEWAREYSADRSVAIPVFVSLPCYR